MPHSSDLFRCLPPRRHRHALIVARKGAAAGVFVAALALSMPAGAQDRPAAPSTVAPPAASQALPLPPRAPASFADLAEKQIETVVYISTTQAPQQNDARGPELPDFPPGSPFGEFFKEFRDRQRGQQHQQQQQQPTMALGSGFVIDSSGFVVTNGHVVSDAEEIHVTLHDGTRLPAKVVGVDQPTDLALLKVEASHPLASAAWGDSEHLRIGDWVVAIGNPFGLGGSVTAGILSARQRDIQQGPYDDYLQTDASINRGNSGGPLYDLSGQVIGINTAIYSPSGGSVGIGFAIPSSVARPVIDQLRDHGQVRRGWLGVQVQRVTPDIADNFGMPEPKGALITNVTPDSPAGKSGVRQGDIVTRFDGKEIGQMRELPRIVAATGIGKTVPLDILRGGHPQSLKVTVGELEPQPQQVASAGSSGEPRAATPRGSKTVLGLTLAPLTDGLRESFSINADIEGVVVTEVGENSPASDRGLEPGDVIVEAAQEPVKTPDELDKRVQQAREQGRKTVLMLVNHEGDLRYIPMPVGDKRG